MRSPFRFMWGIDEPMKTAVVHVGKYLDGLDRICNHNCLFCMERMEPDMSNRVLPSVAQIEAAIEKYRSKNGAPVRLYVAGGEPTMREDLGIILRVAKKICRDVVLSTNCDFEDNRRIIHLLEEYDVNEVATSIHGSTPAIHDKITGALGSFIRTMRAIDMLGKEGIKVNVNCVICKENIEDMPYILTTIQKLFRIRRLVFTHFCFHGFAFYNPKLLFSALEYKEVIGETIDRASKGHFPVLFRDFPLCTDERIVERQERVDDVDIISLDDEYMDISRSEGAPKLELEECKECRHYKICPRFLLSNYGEGCK